MGRALLLIDMRGGIGRLNVTIVYTHGILKANRTFSKISVGPLAPTLSK